METVVVNEPRAEYGSYPAHDRPVHHTPGRHACALHAPAAGALCTVSWGCFPESEPGNVDTQHPNGEETAQRAERGPVDPSHPSEAGWRMPGCLPRLGHVLPGTGATLGRVATARWPAPILSPTRLSRKPRCRGASFPGAGPAGELLLSCSGACLGVPLCPPGTLLSLRCKTPSSSQEHRLLGHRGPGSRDWVWRAHPCAFCGGRGLGGSRAGAGVGGQPPGPRHPLRPVLLSDRGAVSWAPRGWLCRHALPRAFPLPSAVGSRQRCGDTAPVTFSCFSSLTRAALHPCLRLAAHTPQQPWRTAGPPTQDSRGSVSSSVCQVGDEGSRTVGPGGLGPQFRLAAGSRMGARDRTGCLSSLHRAPGEAGSKAHMHALAQPPTWPARPGHFAHHSEPSVVTRWGRHCRPHFTEDKVTSLGPPSCQGTELDLRGCLSLPTPGGHPSKAEELHAVCETSASSVNPDDISGVQPHPCWGLQMLGTSFWATAHGKAGGGQHALTSQCPGLGRVRRGCVSKGFCLYSTCGQRRPWG